jgi:uncharacterized protein (TIGR03086 family)
MNAALGARPTNLTEAVPTTVDLGPAAERLVAMLPHISDAQLGAPTPCPKYTVGDLVEHIGGLTIAFTQAAHKSNTLTGPPRPGDAARLEDGWRGRIATDLAALADAWRDPQAWTGMTNAGGVEMPGAIGGLVALDELVQHGWDLATATGHEYDLDRASLEACLGILEQFGDGRGDAFAEPVAQTDGAPLLDRVVALSGRDPGWRPPQGD